MYGPRGSIVSGDLPWVQQMPHTPEALNMDSGVSFSKQKRLSISKGVAFLILLAFIACIAATGLLVYFLTSCQTTTTSECLERGSNSSNEKINHDHPAEIPNQEITTEPPVTKSIIPDQQHIRLPRSVVPKEYELRIVPFLEETNLTFRGEVMILVNITEPTENITLHSVELVIDESTASVTSVENINVPIKSIQPQNDLQFLIFYFDNALEPGDYVIKINYSGNLNAAMQGFYKSSYTKNKEERWLAATQFQPTDARRALPCFDEPALKAAFTLTIGRPNNMSSISNMPKIKSEPAEGIPNYTWDFYQKSLPMSTYLLAFIVSDFKSKKSGVVSVWARDDAIDQTMYSLEVAPNILKYYETFFGIPLPLPKMDMVALPDFSAGAMENWGLLTYRESHLLYEEGVSMRRYQQRIAVVIAHELAHQWFGNLVTPTWWTDLWLNEGFASYLEYHGTNAVHPEWKVLDQFVINELQSVFQLDALKSSHPISIEVNNPEEINDIFDRISYAKGAAIIRMMESILTIDVFKKGLKHYLNEKAYSNAQQDDLWEALTVQAHESNVLASNMTVKLFMDSWTLQMGFPLLTVERDYKMNKIILKQERFFLDQNETDLNNSIWWIPITYTDSTKMLNTLWMHEETKELTCNTTEENWLIFNLNQTGFYRVNYDKKNWDLIIEQLHKNHSVFDPKNRAQIIDDALNLASAGYLDYATAMNVTSYLTKETDYVPWVAAFKGLDYLYNMFLRTGYYDLFKNYMLKLLLPSFEKLGFRDSKWDSLLTVYMKSDILLHVCRFDHRECISEVSVEFRNWQVSQERGRNPISTNLKGIIYCTAMRIGGEIEWNFLWDQYLKTNVGSEKELIQASLACTKQTWLLNKYLNMAFTEGSGIRKQDAPSVFSAVSNNIIGQPLAYNFLASNWDRIKTYLGSSFLSLNGMIRSVSTNFNTEQEVITLKNLVNSKHKDLASSMRPVYQAIESAEANVEWMKKHFDSIKAWLETTRV